MHELYTYAEFITGQQSADCRLRDTAARYGWYGNRAYDVYREQMGAK